MITVYLKDLHFHSFHGIHEEEKVIGNEYIVNASVDFQEELEIINSINDTVNYADIYNIIRERMNVPTPLLETVVMEIGNEIHNEFPHLKNINISLQKMNPPIEGIEGSAGIIWQRKF